MPSVRNAAPQLLVPSPQLQDRAVGFPVPPWEPQEPQAVPRAASLRGRLPCGLCFQPPHLSRYDIRGFERARRPIGRNRVVVRSAIFGDTRNSATGSFNATYHTRRQW